MTIIESLALIPASFYISAVFLPVALFGYRTAATPRKIIKIKSARPEDQLKDQRIVLQKEINMMVFLGASIALGITLMVSIGTILQDYRESRNLFAAPLPVKTFPPAPEIAFPPAPPAGVEAAPAVKPGAESAPNK